MRLPSAAAYKGTGRKNKPYPREGTKIRALYDFFHERKGQIFPHTFTEENDRRKIQRLIDEYGCDIRCVRRGGSVNQSMWLFAGEWIDNKYIEYFKPGALDVRNGKEDIQNTGPSPACDQEIEGHEA